MRTENERLHLNLAKIKKGGENFEIDVDPDLAVKFKQDQSVDIRDVLKVESIFKDIQKGLFASSAKLKEIFKTEDPLEVAKIILKEGEIQVSAEHRTQLRENKKKRIISIISVNGIDPRTKLPHPPARIESAMEQAKIKIDEYKSPEDQIKKILSELQPILPIAFAKKKIWIKIPVQFASKAQSTVMAMATLLNESWNNDGSWESTVEVPGGLEQEFYDKLNKATKGEVQTKTIGE